MSHKTCNLLNAWGWIAWIGDETRSILLSSRFEKKNHENTSKRQIKNRESNSFQFSPYVFEDKLLDASLGSAFNRVGFCKKNNNNEIYEELIKVNVMENVIRVEIIISMESYRLAWDYPSLKE